MTHLKRPWCWERLKVGEGDDRGWDDWMVSLTQWTWVWVNPGSWWWTGRPGVLQSMGWQRVRHDWATELNWTVQTLVYKLYTCTSNVLDVFEYLVLLLLPLVFMNKALLKNIHTLGMEMSFILNKVSSFKQGSLTLWSAFLPGQNRRATGLEL